MINRVWKRTFYKIGMVLAFLSAVLGYVGGSALVGHYFFDNSAAGLVSGMALYFVVMIVHTTYKDAKREIENENDELLRKLQLEKYKDR